MNNKELIIEDYDIYTALKNNADNYLKNLGFAIKKSGYRIIKNNDGAYILSVYNDINKLSVMFKLLADVLEFDYVTIKHENDSFIMFKNEINVFKDGSISDSFTPYINSIVTAMLKKRAELSSTKPFAPDMVFFELLDLVINHEMTKVTDLREHFEKYGDFKYRNKRGVKSSILHDIPLMSDVINLSTGEIVDKYGVSSSTVRTWRKRIKDNISALDVTMLKKHYTDVIYTIAKLVYLRDEKGLVDIPVNDVIEELSISRSDIIPILEHFDDDMTLFYNYKEDTISSSAIVDAMAIEYKEGLWATELARKHPYTLSEFIGAIDRVEYFKGHYTDLETKFKIYLEKTKEENNELDKKWLDDLTSENIPTFDDNGWDWVDVLTKGDA